MGQKLTWEVHLCPGSGAVCPASAVWVPRHHHQNQTMLHCDWLCLCLCYSSQFLPAVGSGKQEQREDCNLTLHRHNIQNVTYGGCNLPVGMGGIANFIRFLSASSAPKQKLKSNGEKIKRIQSSISSYFTGPQQKIYTVFIV